MPLNETFVKELGKHIDKLRRERNLSFQEMADKCDMDKAQVYKICTLNERIKIKRVKYDFVILQLFILIIQEVRKVTISTK